MDELKKIVTEFREGILSGAPSAFMCMAVCVPMESYLSMCGYPVSMVHGTVDLPDYDMDHVWLELPDGTIVDPTADQFSELNLPPVYIGVLPAAYTASPLD